ncbi:glycosyltransferase family 2 protein [Arthrobacter sp.]|uniref:glycosyltransferase family 2 protein n=1 Tax=Arthrobacter sp. TaxID=1667 RepID=UPI002898C6A4|nr:glycosyltransferase family 2 protein [Arthrobacter sp.]
MRQTLTLLARLTPGHRFLFGGTGILLLAVMILGLTGSPGPALAGLALLSFIALAVTVLYLSLLSGRLARDGQQQLAQGRVVLEGMAWEKEKASARPAAQVADESFHFDASAAWAQYIAERPRRLETFVNQAKKTRSYGARNVLAYAATRGRMDWRAMSLFLAARRWNPESVRGSVQAWWVPGARALARVLFCQRIRDDDLNNALTLYEAIIEEQGRAVLDPIDCSYLADLLVTGGRQNEVEEALAFEQETTVIRRLSQALLQVNAANPYISGSLSDEQGWMQELNDILASRGLAPLVLEPGSATAFYRLRGNVPPCEGDRPLVTVIMPIYEPDSSTSAAVDSLLAQTWTNLEIIMVDDGSPLNGEDGRETDYRDLLHELAGRDPRITLILNEENRGAYWARNVAYAKASGKYVTVADKDDWHHPQKIELQARDLEEKPERPANMVQWSRVDENLRFLFRWGPDRIIHPSFASIMYRRGEIQSKLGYWDSVRKSADNEFRMRLQHVYEEKIPIIGEVPLAFSLLGEGNLTSQDFGLGFEQPERRIYRKSYESWHRAVDSGAESAFLPMQPLSRAFPAPGSFLPERPSPGRFDVVYVSAYEYDGQEASDLLGEVKRAVAQGQNVGVVAAESYLKRRNAGSPGLTEIERLFAEGAIEELAFDHEARTSLLVIWDPIHMQVARDAKGTLLADRVLIRAETGPSDRSGGFRRYDVVTVEETIRGVLGVVPEWVVLTESARAELHRLVPVERVMDCLLSGPVGAEGFHIGAARIQDSLTPTGSFPS